MNSIPSPDVFAFGWYAVGGANPPAPEPWNLILVQGTDSNLVDELDSIAAQGMWAVVQVNDKSAANALLQNGEICSHAALWGWYLFDEPDAAANAPSVQVLETIYSNIKSQESEDPRARPVLINFAYAKGTGLNGVTENAYTCRQAMDICMQDSYPITVLNQARQPAQEFDGLGGWTSTASNPPLVFPPWVDLVSDALAAAREAGKPFFMVLQAYGWPGTVLAGDYPADLGGHKQPTHDEQRYMAYTAIQLGVRGLFFWAPGDGDLHGDTGVYRSNVVDVVLREIQVDISSFAKGSIGQLQTSAAEVAATLYTDAHFHFGNGYVLLLIHHGNGNINTGVTIQNPVIGSTVFNDPRAPALPPIGAEVFETSLGPYEVRVYKFSLPPYSGSVLSGVVTHADGSPADDATVLIQSAKLISPAIGKTLQLSTDSTGGYSTTLRTPFPAGVYSVSVAQSGFLDSSTSVFVTANQPFITQNFVLNPALTITIHGVVTDRGNTPIANATVQVVQGGATGILETVTDVNGAYSITSALAPIGGDFFITVQADGFESSTADRIITNGETVAQDFSLLNQT